MNVYFIPGLGADHRLFTHLRLPEGHQPFHIHWIPPHQEEKLKDYAGRLAAQIDHAKPFILIGISLGGIMAVEIANRYPPVSTILISSVSVKAHLPKYYRLAYRLGLGKLVPVSFLKMATSIKHSLTMRSPSNRKLMRDIIRSGNDRFIRWALNAVLEWDNSTIPQPLFHIHGSRDEIFPVGLTKPTHVIPNGHHMLSISRPDSVNKILREIITPIPAI